MSKGLRIDFIPVVKSSQIAVNLFFDKGQECHILTDSITYGYISELGVHLILDLVSRQFNDTNEYFKARIVDGLLYCEYTQKNAVIEALNKVVDGLVDESYEKLGNSLPQIKNILSRLDVLEKENRLLKEKLGIVNEEDDDDQ